MTDLSDSERPVSEAQEARPLDTPLQVTIPWRRWAVILLLVSGTGLAWMAMRTGSPDSVRNAVDTMVEVGGGLLLALAAYQVLNLFAFRVLDLLVMVIVMSTGIFVTINSMRALVDVGFLAGGRLEDEKYLGRVLQVCLVVCSVLMAGGALGLRFCSGLRLDQPLQRLWAIFCGMLALPAASGVFALGVLAIASVFGENEPSEHALQLTLGWIASLLISSTNAVFLIRTMALKSEIVSHK